MCGTLLKDWFQTSLILSPVLSLIVGDEPVLYTMPVLVDRLPKCISMCMLSSCSVNRFKSELDSYLRNIVDLPCQPGFNNSLDGGDCLHGGHYADDLAAK